MLEKFLEIVKMYEFEESEVEKENGEIKRCEFFDDLEYMIFNDMSKMKPVELICIDKDEYVNKEKLGTILNKIESKLFMFVNKIYLTFTEEGMNNVLDEWALMECDYVGRFCGDEKIVIVDVFTIVNTLKEKYGDVTKEDIVCQIMLTLIHELGHSVLEVNEKYEFISKEEVAEFIPEIMEYTDDEITVENLAERIFEDLDYEKVDCVFNGNIVDI